MLNKKDCIVVIPVYKTLEVNEKRAIKQAIDMTPGIDKVFIMPNSFIIDESFTDFEDILIERFEDYFFADILGYNRLMLNVNFYKRFNNYRYMLIHQTDAFLFSPDLQDWCDKNYDYIGAPWLCPDRIKKAKLYKIILSICPWIYSPFKQRLVKRYNNVGNGGLSLRKIETFIKILESFKMEKVLNTYFEKMVSDTFYNEDIFWSFEGRRLYKKFRKPDWREAMHFAVEFEPSFAFNQMNKRLPFGCHAIFVHEPEFWKEYIPFIYPE